MACDLTAPISPPSPWVARHSAWIAPGGWVLDLAAGGGRHSRFLRQRGHPVLAVDRDTTELTALAAGGGDGPALEILARDLEDGAPWPFGDRRFAGIVVTNYLHRPLLPHLAAALAPGGVLIYETFAVGNERFGRPSNPAFLLEPGELLAFAQINALTVLGYFNGFVSQPRPAMVQRLAAQQRGATS